MNNFVKKRTSVLLPGDIRECQAGGAGDSSFANCTLTGNLKSVQYYEGVTRKAAVDNNGLVLKFYESLKAHPVTFALQPNHCCRQLHFLLPPQNTEHFSGFQAEYSQQNYYPQPLLLVVHVKLQIRVQVFVSGQGYA